MAIKGDLPLFAIAVLKLVTLFILLSMNDLPLELRESLFCSVCDFLSISTEALLVLVAEGGWTLTFELLRMTLDCFLSTIRGRLMSSLVEKSSLSLFAEYGFSKL